MFHFEIAENGKSVQRLIDSRSKTRNSIWLATIFIASSCSIGGDGGNWNGSFLGSWADQPKFIANFSSISCIVCWNSFGLYLVAQSTYLSLSRALSFFWEFSLSPMQQRLRLHFSILYIVRYYIAPFLYLFRFFFSVATAMALTVASATDWANSVCVDDRL